MQQKNEPVQKKSGRVGLFYGLSLIGVAFLIGHFSKSRKKQPENAPEYHGPPQSLQPEPNKETVMVPSGPSPSKPDSPPASRGEDNPNCSWYDSREKREKVTAICTVITLFLFVLYVVATFLLFLIGGLQLREMSKQTLASHTVWITPEGNPEYRPSITETGKFQIIRHVINRSDMPAFNFSTTLSFQTNNGPWSHPESMFGDIINSKTLLPSNSYWVSANGSYVDGQFHDKLSCGLYRFNTEYQDIFGRNVEIIEEEELTTNGWVTFGSDARYEGYNMSLGTAARRNNQ